MRYERYVVAYDITKTKRRNKVAKLLQGWGERVNYSVFECELKKGDLPRLRRKILKRIDRKNDSVIFYPLCLTCRASVVYDGRPVKRKLDQSVLMI